jgi:hypothetical protein
MNSIEWLTFVNTILDAKLVKVESGTFHRFYEHWATYKDKQKLVFLNGPINEYEILEGDNQLVTYDQTHYTAFVRIYDQVEAGEDYEGYMTYDNLETYSMIPIRFQIWSPENINYSL